MSSKVATVRPLFATATSTFCRMSELRQLPLPADDSAAAINEASTLAMASASTTTTAAAMSHIRSGAMITATARVPPTVADVKRKLFGPDKPEDQEVNIRFVQQELREIANQDMIKWNFNFQDDKPLEGRFKWEETNASQVPLAYNMTHLCSSSSSSMTRPLPITMANSKTSHPAHSNNVNPGPPKTSSRALIVKVPSSVKACRNLSFSNTNTVSTKTNINNNSTDLNSRINFKVTTDNHRTVNTISATTAGASSKITACNKKESDVPLPTNIIPSIQRLQEKTSTSRQPSISEFMPQRKRRSSTVSSGSAHLPSQAFGAAEGVGETLDDGYSSEEPSAKKAKAQLKQQVQPDQGQ